MDSEEKKRFSGIVYARRNRKNNKKGVSPATGAAVETAAADVTAPETTNKVSKSADLTDNTTSVNVPDGGVESSAAGAVIVGLEKRFSGKVYSRRNRKTQGLLNSTYTSGNVPDATGVESRCGREAVVLGLERRFSGKVYSRRNRKSQDLLNSTSTSGNVPDGGVES